MIHKSVKIKNLSFFYFRTKFALTILVFKSVTVAVLPLLTVTAVKNDIAQNIVGMVESASGDIQCADDIVFWFVP